VQAGQQERPVQAVQLERRVLPEELVQRGESERRERRALPGELVQRGESDRKDPSE
jgi:hypothetical protein